VETSVPEAEEKLSMSRFTRAIIYSDTIDEVLGSVHLKDLVRANNSGDKGPLSELIKPVLTVPEMMPILELLPKMQAAFIHIAIVKDGEGLTQGIVTQEDVLEEIVGEIRDEYDHEEVKRIQKINANKYEVLGRVTLHDFDKESQWGIVGERGDTMGDLIFNKLGRYPAEGELIEFDSFNIKVKQISGYRLVRIELTRTLFEEK